VVEVWSVHATEDACDLAMRAPGAGRVASDEVVVRGSIAEDLAAAVRTVDPHALIRESTEGWAEVTLEGAEGRDVFARLSDLRLPDGKGYVQGDVARAAARVFVDEAGLHVLVPASLGSYLRRRVEEGRPPA
jgi:hypothetical protein